MNVRHYLNTSRTMQVAWLVFALTALSLALAGMAGYRAILESICDGTRCLSGQLTSAEAQRAVAAGTTLAQYGAIVFAVYVFTDAMLFLMALALTWRKPVHPAAVCGAFALTAAATVAPAHAAARAIPSLALPVQTLEFIQLAALLPFFCLIPDGRFDPRWLRWPALAMIPVAAGVAFAPDALGEMGASVLGAAVGLLILASVVWRYRQLAGRQQQEPVAWTLAAIMLLSAAQGVGRPLRLLPLPAMPAGGLPPELLAFLPVFGMLLVVGALTCLAVAFFSDDLFRVDVALNRAIVYAVLTLFVVASYAAVVGYLSLLFQSSGSLWFSLAATGVVAVLFQPIRERVQRFVNRTIYGEPNDPYTVLARLGRQLETALAAEEVFPTILNAVKAAFQVSHAAIRVQEVESGGEALISGTGGPVRFAVEVPLVYQNATVGFLQLGPRSGGRQFTLADQRLLDDLARQAGAAIHAARQNADLHLARQRLVTAREEERRRLRRDLHDGLGASLAALNLQAGELQRLIGSDPDAAKRQVETLRDEIRAAIGDIRRLVYGLRPPALDELGLVEALRARAAQASGRAAYAGHRSQPATALQIEVLAPAELPALPAAVEAAAYRIALEALTNCIQHACAGRCTICLHLDRGGLTVEVCDDGKGLPEEYQFGVGLISMRERCAELGGTLSIASAPNRGTQLSAWLPLPAGSREE